MRSVKKRYTKQQNKQNIMLSSIGTSFSKYFSPRKKIYPQYQKGRFRQLKSRLNIFFLIFYGILPFLRFDRGEESPNQAILLDFTTRKIYFFKLEIDKYSWIK